MNQLKIIYFKLKVFTFLIIFFQGMPLSQQVEITSGEINRTFRINIPNDTSGSLPMIILMHGMGQSSANMYGPAIYFSNANFISVRPQSGSYENSSGDDYTTLWNAIVDTQKLDDVKFISDIIDYMIINYEFVDFKRIYVAGFSNGGYMAYRLSCDLSKRVTAFGSVAGNMYLIDDELDCRDQGREIPIIHIHGTSDIMNPYYPGGYGLFGDDIIGDQYLTIEESIEFWNTYHQYDMIEIDTILTDISIRYTYSSGESISQFMHIKVEEGQHEWFYGDNFGFSSTQEILDFTSQYELPDFIINMEDVNSDGLFNNEDIDIVVESIIELGFDDSIYDFNFDQLVDVIDILILSEFIY